LGITARIGGHRQICEKGGNSFPLSSFISLISPHTHFYGDEARPRFNQNPNLALVLPPQSYELPRLAL
jgi:hypothetical protein